MIRNDTDYALRMVVYLAGRNPPGAATAELSAGLGVPHGFAQKILRRLAAAGILKVRLGRGGGFSLNRKPDRVSLREVIVAIQGPPRLNRCMAGPGACALQTSCKISASLKPIQRKLDAFLSGTSLSDILGRARPRRKAP